MFEIESRNVGLGSKMAMKRFDDMTLKFKETLKEAAQELEENGIKGVEYISRMIIEKRKI